MILYQDRFISVHGSDSDGGQPWFDYIQSDDGSLVIPLTESNEVILAVEPSRAFGESVLILPGGIVEPDEQPEAAANRELQEELGLRAARLHFLGEVHPWDKYLRCRHFIFLGRDLSPSKLTGDEAHEVGTERVPLADFERLIAGGRLRDASAIAGLYMARQYIEAETKTARG
jgi:ADP-ribose diphosphatase